MMLVIFLLLPFLNSITGVRIVNFHVPDRVASGDSVWLNCSYELQSEELYSIKWFKDHIEFYRYTPNVIPSNKFFQLKGVYVNLSKSHEGHVYLYKTDQFSAGSYSCKVYAGAPSFEVVQKLNELFIYDPTTIAP